MVMSVRIAVTPLLALLIATATACGITHEVRAEPCGAPSGTETVANAEVLIVGEYHGTNEIPPTFAAIVCQIVADRPDDRIVVGLELPADFNVAFAAAGQTGASAAYEKIQSHSFWDEMGDGRHSAAMLAMVRSLLSIAAKDERVHIVAIENRDFDTVGASFFVEQLRLFDADSALVLTGNAHARKEPVKGYGVVPFGQRVAQLGRSVTSLNIEAGGGYIWLCGGPSGCRQHPLSSRQQGDRPYIELRPCQSVCPYDGVLYLPMLSVSEPASDVRE